MRRLAIYLILFVVSLEGLAHVDLGVLILGLGAAMACIALIHVLFTPDYQDHA